MSPLTHADPSLAVVGVRAGFPSTRWWTARSLAVGAVCVLVALVSPTTALVTAVAGVSVAVGWADVRWRRIPNPVLVVAACFTAAVAVVWDGSRLESVAVGAVLTCLPALVLHLVNPRWVGFGDVKLLATLGALLGVVWVLAGLVALWLAMLLALVGHAFVPAAWRREVPFGFWLSLCAVPVSIFSAGSIAW